MNYSGKCLKYEKLSRHDPSHATQCDVHIRSDVTHKGPHSPCGKGPQGSSGVGAGPWPSVDLDPGKPSCGRIMLKILVPLLLLLPSVCGQVGGLRAAKFKHYSYFNYKRTWAEAQVFCRRNHTDLVTIRNEEENRAFLNIYGWIGLYREDSNSPWKWSRGGEIANFITWVSGGKQGQHVTELIMSGLSDF
uniref:C-type lectin domain-containing protein n=1 Tax=Seriola dumerili TaxID=41447 RepID=A0A3B4TQQ4_SERDU